METATLPVDSEPVVAAVPAAAIAATFAAQQAHHPVVRATTATERIEKLKRLRAEMMARKEDISAALHADLGRHPAETELVEIMPILIELQHTIRHLKNWMRPKRTKPSLLWLGTKSEVRYEPKGVTLILAPWNFPFQLIMGPLISAIAAGNCAILKPSEFTPQTSAVLQALIKQVFDETEVALFEGDYRVSQALLQHPFDHIFFTGSPAVGKIIMRAAAEHLSSVTLELGGKSPTIVDETANLEAAAETIITGKFINAGQICIAPDYLYVHESVHDVLVGKLRQVLDERYGQTDDARAQTADYARMVNSQHLARVHTLLDDAVAAGAHVVTGGQTQPAARYFAPTLLTEVAPTMQVMQEEIFGPVLPILPYTSLDEVLATINEKHKPLTLYIYSKNKTHIEQVLNRTSAGTSMVNNTLLHFINPEVPFGGVNHSGLGKSHGWYGFEAFSNARTVMYQNWAFHPIQWVLPPYKSRQKTIRDAFSRYFHW